jgi:hypothetical protein
MTDGGGLYYADISEEIAEIKLEVPNWIEAARETLSSGEPSIAPGSQCKKPFDCPFFGYCSPTAGSQDT